jgi:hypothetical protein
MIEGTEFFVKKYLNNMKLEPNQYAMENEIMDMRQILLNITNQIYPDLISLKIRLPATLDKLLIFISKV